MTIPGTPVTGVPVRGERCAAPCTSLIRAATAGTVGEGVGVEVGVPPVAVAVAVGLTSGVGVAVGQESGKQEGRGLGAPTAKSAALSSVSTVPLPARRRAVVLLPAGAGPAPSKKLAPPYPTRSAIWARASGGQGMEPPLQPSEVGLRTRATLPAVALRLIGEGSVTSGGGRGLPAAPLASWTSR